MLPRAAAVPAVAPKDPPLDSPSHILHVFPTFRPAGAQVRATALMRAFGDRFRHTVVACDGQTDAVRLAGGVDVRTVPWSPGGGPLAAVRHASELLAQHRPDLLLTYNWGSMDAVLAARSRRFARHVHHEDGFNADEAERLKARRNWARRMGLHGTDVVVPSARLEEIARRTWRLPRVHFIPNGVEAGRFARDADAGVRFREDHGVPADAFVLGTVGHLRPVKRFDRLLRAAAAAPWPPGVRPWVVIVGDGEERAALQNIARETEAAGVGVTLTGHIEDLRPAYSAFDVFTLTSDSEQQPVSLLEAMAASLPVAATDVGDIAKSLPAEARRRVVPKDARVSQSLGESFAALAADPTRRAELGALGLAHVRTEYANEAMAERYLRVYEAALER